MKRGLDSGYQRLTVARRRWKVNNVNYFLRSAFYALALKPTLKISRVLRAPGVGRATHAYATSRATLLADACMRAHRARKGAHMRPFGRGSVQGTEYAASELIRVSNEKREKQDG
jgi:hypothetical protein